MVGQDMSVDITLTLHRQRDAKEFHTILAKVIFDLRQLADFHDII